MISKKMLFSFMLGVIIVGTIQTADNFQTIMNQDINDAQLSREDQEFIYPIHQAVKSAVNTQILQKLLDKGADINTRSKTGKTPLFYAIKYNKSPQIIKFLIEHGASTNIADNDGNTLFHAILLANNRSENKSKNIETLLILGLDPTFPNEKGIIPFDQSMLIRELNAAVNVRTEDELF